MAKATQMDAKYLLMADINSIQERAGVRQTVGDLANTISQSAKMVADVVELARYELVDMKHEARERLLANYA